MSPMLVELLAQLQAGSEAALLALHEQYATVVYSVAYRVLNDQMAAEEVTQDTFMRLWHKAETYDPAKGAFASWLLTITRRLAIDLYRKQRRDPMQNPIFMDANTDYWENMLDADVNSELRRTLVALLGDLPADQRHVIELAYFHGMSHGQIAEYTAQPVGTIKTRIRLGMQKLREAWLTEPVSHPNQEE